MAGFVLDQRGYAEIIDRFDGKVDAGDREWKLASFGQTRDFVTEAAAKTAFLQLTKRIKSRIDAYPHLEYEVNWGTEHVEARKTTLSKAETLRPPKHTPPWRRTEWYRIRDASVQSEKEWLQRTQESLDERKQEVETCKKEIVALLEEAGFSEAVTFEAAQAYFQTRARPELFRQDRRSKEAIVEIRTKIDSAIGSMCWNAINAIYRSKGHLAQRAIESGRSEDFAGLLEDLGPPNDEIQWNRDDRMYYSVWGRRAGAYLTALELAGLPSDSFLPKLEEVSHDPAALFATSVVRREMGMIPNDLDLDISVAII